MFSYFFTFTRSMSDQNNKSGSDTDDINELGVDDDVPLVKCNEPSTCSDSVPAGPTSFATPVIESEEENEDVPSREQCQSLTEQFSEVTGTNTALAQFFLQDRHWNLEKSVNAYFESHNKGVNSLDGGKQPELAVLFDSRIMTAIQEGQISTVAPTRFKLISWNIDGLEKINLKRRTKAVIKTIEKEGADIVFLQEVVPVVHLYLEEKLPQYMFIAAGSDGYFTVIMLLRTTIYFDGHELIKYSGSGMGRNLLMVEAHIGSCYLRLLTAHLESTAECTEERKRQLKIALNRMTAPPLGLNAILAGDLNLRDKEVQEVCLPPGVVDVWEAMGRRKEVQYTWDLTRNTNKQLSGTYQPRCRFDRIYLRSGDGSSTNGSSEDHTSSTPGVEAATTTVSGCLQAATSTSGAGAAGNSRYKKQCIRQSNMVVPKYFGLVGLKKVSHTQSFPSDHWGLLTHFEIVAPSERPCSS